MKRFLSQEYELRTLIETRGEIIETQQQAVQHHCQSLDALQLCPIELERYNEEGHF
jgi:hypothetical protein